MCPSEFDEAIDSFSDLIQRQSEQEVILSRNSVAVSLESFGLTIDRSAMIFGEMGCTFPMPPRKIRPEDEDRYLF